MTNILDRRQLLVGAIALSLTPQLVKAAPSRRPPHILFVCQFGTVKSPIARELLKRRAVERGIPTKVASRGITPADHVTPALLQRLASDGIDPYAEPLLRLRARDIRSADIVVVFNPLPPSFRPDRLEDWTELPSMVNDYDQARTILDQRIDSLLDSFVSG